MSQPRKQIVLLGIGHTNAHVLKQWVEDPIPGCDLIGISPFPTSTYSGMLPGTLGLQFRDDQWRIDLNSLCQRANAKLMLAQTNGLDLSSGQIHFADHESIQFDVLSIGVGSMPIRWQQHRDSPLLVPIKPMQTFLSRLSTRLADMDHPHVAIVGGGVAGIEIAFCLQEQFQKELTNDQPAITIFTSGQRVADGMTDRSVRRIEKLLTARDIHVRAGQRVVEVDEEKLSTEDGQSHQVGCVIWATGAAPPPVLETLGLQTDASGFVATTDTLQSLSDSRIFAVGDSGTVLASPSPKAGVYAVRQSPILWHNLRAFVQGGNLRTFRPQSDFLKILNTGDGKALLQYKWLTVHARWCWNLKTRIDQGFIDQFTETDQNSGTDHNR